VDRLVKITLKKISSQSDNSIKNRKHLMVITVQASICMIFACVIGFVLKKKK
jgi:hypothetical protein